MREVPTLKVTWPYAGHVTNWKCPLSQNLRSLNLAGRWLQGGGLERKGLSRHWLVLLGFNPCKAEQALRGIELRGKRRGRREKGRRKRLKAFRKIG